MTITTHVYQIFIRATPEQVWQAITDSDWTRRYFHQTAFVAPPVQGQPYRTVLPNGDPAVEGVIEEMDPPHRFVQTWRVLYDAAMAEEPPSRVEWQIDLVGENLTRVRLVHGDLAFSPLTWASVRNGWVWVLDSLKSLLETGAGLPRLSADQPDRSSEQDRSTDADWHRAQAVEANNSVWELVQRDPRSAEDDEELLRRAYAAGYHWDRAAGRGPQTAARADYMIAKALLLTGHPGASLSSADRCLDQCVRAGLADFDLAYAHEARARALRALGRPEEAARAWAEATSVPIANPEDRAILQQDFADY
ncbi:hypothetical protein GCM10009841_17240 [Microlunatus panaciterrae]|uniref:Uncharacterized protein YndB with AHSA1/START domain n=1 Tax=Microlunatus panaciterrae TaxID=400768 RepID=A0ABS2RNP1_9ACTN|nr:SRPBCC family protein [Microlunatus panaciterrae]MBM7800283.1 uncharacterized protein YndB with AHSA1/START domain [Microlunatus panaciterrae]